MKFTWNSKVFIQENVCANVVCEIVAILHRGGDELQNMDVGRLVS